MDLASFRAFVPQSCWASLDLYSLAETPLRPRGANELFSGSEIAGCQNVFPALCIQEKSGQGWSAFVSLRRFYQGCYFFFFQWCLPDLHTLTSLSGDFFFFLLVILSFAQLKGVLIVMNDDRGKVLMKQPWRNWVEDWYLKKWHRGNNTHP